MPFTEDLSPFFNADEFATVATFVPSGGEASSVSGIFDDDYSEALGMDSARALFTCAAADVPDVAAGDALTINGAAYKVKNVRPDATGLVALPLELQ